MLTVLHPELMQQVAQMPMGLLVLNIVGAARPVLVVKGPKEMLLAAQLNKGFKIYVAPIKVGEEATVGLVTAFFDDDDQPLAFFSPMLDEPHSTDLRDAVLREELDVHLFDERSRELLGYTAVVKAPPATRIALEQARLLPPTLAAARAALDQLPWWLGARDPADDAVAIAVDFGEALVSEELFIMDMRPEHHAAHGSRPFSHSTLVRQEPGSFQEHDIVNLLQRIFPAEQIYLGPLRLPDKEEIADVIVITPARVLLIQAKDSPNTKQILRNTLARKKATTLKSLLKAIKQMQGAVRYSRSQSPLRLLVSGNEVAISIDDLKLACLVVVKELFNDEYSEYSPPLLQLAQDAQVPCIALDYTELHSYTMYLADEHEFFDAYDRVFSVALEHGQYPRLRFGVGDSRSAS